MRTTRRLLPYAALACALAVALVAADARAQAYPTKPVKAIVNFPPGGPLDLMARAIGEKLAASLGQPVVVENRGGAAGNIGAEAVARSAPDGYTLLVTIDTTFTVNPTVYASMPFTLASFEPLMLIATSGLVFGVNPGLGADTVAQVITKGRTQELTFSSAGNGSPGHLEASILRDKAGVKAVHVPYKGNAAAVLALVSGEVQVGVLGAPGMVPHVKSGKIKALAVTSRKRSPLAPEVPTVAEAGMPELELEVLYLMMAPAGTPQAGRELLQRQLAAALAAPDVRARLTSVDLDPSGETGEAVLQRLQANRDRYAETIRRTGMKAE